MMIAVTDPGYLVGRGASPLKHQCNFPYISDDLFIVGALGPVYNVHGKQTLQQN